MHFLTVYADVLFVTNFLINFLVLYLAGKIGRLARNPWRLILGAAVGAVYALCMFFPKLSFGYGAAAKLVFSLFVVALTYNIRGVRLYIKTVLVFYLVTFCLGGSVMALFYFTGLGARLGAVVKNGIFYIHIPWQILLFAVLLSYEIIRWGWGALQSRLSRENMYRKIGICWNGEEVWIDALLDTGNSLSEPLSGAPVIVAEYEKLQPILPPALKGICESPEDAIEIADEKIRGRIRMIPFSSLGKEHGMLLGFRPDRAWVLENESLRDAGSVVVAIYTKTLSRDRSFGALLPPEMLVH